MNTSTDNLRLLDRKLNLHARKPARIFQHDLFHLLQKIPHLGPNVSKFKGVFYYKTVSVLHAMLPFSTTQPFRLPPPAPATHFQTFGASKQAGQFSEITGRCEFTAKRRRSFSRTNTNGRITLRSPFLGEEKIQNYVSVHMPVKDPL
jgi:hypothetical protein